MVPNKKTFVAPKTNNLNDQTPFAILEVGFRGFRDESPCGVPHCPSTRPTTDIYILVGKAGASLLNASMMWANLSTQEQRTRCF